MAGCEYLPPDSFCELLPFPGVVYNDSVRDALLANASAEYTAFQQALSQFNCEKIQYSFVRNCTDCLNAYKYWVRPSGMAPPAVVCPAGVNRVLHAVVRPRQQVCNLYFPECSATVVNANISAPASYGEKMCSGTCWNVFQSCPTFLGVRLAGPPRASHGPALTAAPPLGARRGWRSLIARSRTPNRTPSPTGNARPAAVRRRGRAPRPPWPPWPSHSSRSLYEHAFLCGR